MSKYAVGYRTTTAATNLLPMASLYATAAVRPLIHEIGVFNTTATALSIALVRLTTAGTSTAVSATLVGYETDDSQAAVATPRQSHSSTGPTITSVLRQASLGASIGSGVIFTSEMGFIVPNLTTAGIGITTPNGTGQICDVYWMWRE